MRYQDLVIKDGKFIGKFNELYKRYKDPWLSLKKNKDHGRLKYNLIIQSCLDIRKNFKLKKCSTMEIGCGYPQISDKLLKLKFDTYCTDISEEVILKSKKKYPKLKKKIFNADINDFYLYRRINPKIYIMSEISWYVLPKLKNFIKFFKSRKNCFLIHSLATYEKKKQKYGKNYFYDSKSIMKFFNLKYISHGDFKDLNGDRSSFFIAKSD